MSELPPGWAWTTLGEIGDYLNGRGFKKSEWRESGRPIIRIQNLTGSGDHFNHFDGEAEEHYIARDGDILVAWAATLGVFVWRGPEAVVNQHIFKVQTRINQGFHRYLLLSTLKTLGRQTHGSGMVHITKSKFDGTPVALPPLAEQVRIVAAIEERLSRLDAGDASLAIASARLKGLREAGLRDALAGKWPMATIGEVARSVRNGLFVSRPAASPPGIPIFRISAVRPMALDIEDVRYADVPATEAKPYLTGEGDLLFTRYSGNAELVGACARVPPMKERVLHPDKLIRVVVDRDRVEPAFVELACSAGVGRDEIRARRKTTAGQVGIAGGQLRAVRLPVPPLDEQRRIVARVGEQLSGVESLRASVERTQRRSATLRRAILERAFRGELVQPDPSDEPASVLLKRIHANREPVPARPKRRRVGHP